MSVRSFAAFFVQASLHSLTVSCQGFPLPVGLIQETKLQRPMLCDDENAVGFRPLEIIGDVMNAVSWLPSCSLLYIHGSVACLHILR